MVSQTDCIEFINPATGRKFGEVRRATEADVLRARREMAAVQPQWAAKSAKERARLVKKLQSVILDATDEITAVVNQDHGKSRLDALHEVFMTIEKVHHYCAHAPQWLARERVPRGLYFFKRFFTEREPYGVVGIIGPWNYPIDLMIPPIVSALLAGNAVLIKPSEVAAATGVLLEDLFNRVPELAPYVRFLHGDAQVGQALVHAKPDLIFLTGSVKTGRTVAQMAVEDMTPFMYELGGKDAMLVLEDADVAAAAKWGVWGSFYSTGQACVSVERVYVHEKVYDAFVAAVLEETAKFTVGYSNDIDNPNWMGPLTFQRQCDIVNTHLHDALQKGARILMGGKQTGMFIEPTVLVDVDHTMKLMTEETFGPTMPIMKVMDDQHAIQLANHSDMGLSAYVWSRDLKHAERVGRQLDVGVVNINDTMAHYSVARLPFGGTKLSGNTRTHGRGEVTQFTRQKAYSISHPPNAIDPVIWIRHPGTYRLLKAMMGATYGTSLKQRIEPVGELVGNEERLRSGAARAAAGVGVMSAVAAMALLLLRVRRH
ncbi:MAG: aldehyde dehydrogenase family protein [Candidatus Promineofilum sp.]|nr:aldehyde dehydrogenase family protein [Promineifilum sp.]